jgi:hypothetical protein
VGLLRKWQEFRAGRREKSIARNLKYIQNAKAIREDRSAAIAFFCDIKEPAIAIPALLQRFEYSLEHGINDSREKESCLEGIISHGAVALPLTIEHLKQTYRIAWPIKVLNKVGTEDEVIEALKSCLDYEDIAFDQAKVDKNYDILCFLADYKIPGCADKLMHFMNYHDERVRYAAVEVLVAQSEPNIPDMLEHYLNDVSAENTRIHQCVVSAFVRNKWSIRHPEAIAPAALGNRIVVSKAGILEMRA